MGLLCLAVALILVAVEVVIPASGAMAVTGALALVVGIVLLVWGGGTIGRITAVAALIASPFALIALLWLWPNTPLARMITLHNRDGGDDDSDQDPREPPAASPAAAVGATGTALMDLRPIGTCLIDGRRIECLAEGGMIHAGSNVRVVAADGFSTRVALDQ
jgi:membrane-bound ClpP family serine protease